MKTLKRNLIEKQCSSQEIKNFITGKKLQNRVKKVEWTDGYSRNFAFREVSEIPLT